MPFRSGSTIRSGFVGLCWFVVTTAHANVPATERAVLDAIYYGTGGSSWTHNDGWAIPPNLGISECGSYGISCINVLGQEHVSSVDLSNNGLTGQLPASLSDLPYLQTFNVYYNELTGSIPALTGLTSLKILNVSSNNLSGTIPNLTGLTNLTELYVSANYLTSPIPCISTVSPCFSGLTSLSTLNISSNFGLTGSFPSLAGLTTLQNVYASDTGFDSLPCLSTSAPCSSGLTNLKIFEDIGSDLKGPIPELAGLTSLEHFDVSYNQLTGGTPCLSLVSPCSSGLTSLSYFNAYSNQLDGAISPLAGLTNLEFFDASFNKLNGPIPDLTGLTRLKDFVVYSNQLSGVIPPLAGLTSLQVFRASANKLDGMIPCLSVAFPCSSGLTNLGDFEVNSNRLRGKIPPLEGLGDGLAYGLYFYVGANRLTGSVPVAPANLHSAFLCPNSLDITPQPAIDPAWNAATGTTPWWNSIYPSYRCDDVFIDDFE